MTAPPQTPSGETSLPTLLTTLSPLLHGPVYAFTTHPFPASFTPTPTAPFPTTHLPAALVPLALLTMHEPHRASTTLVVPAAAAPDAPFRCRLITCRVHSSLAAVGLTPAMTGALAKHGIAANVVAGFWSDHVFVEEGRAEEAVGILRGLAGGEGER